MRSWASAAGVSPAGTGTASAVGAATGTTTVTVTAVARGGLGGRARNGGAGGGAALGTVYGSSSGGGTVVVSGVINAGGEGGIGGGGGNGAHGSSATLTDAVQNHHIGIITDGDFLTNDQTGAALVAANNTNASNDSYTNMETLLGLNRSTGGNSGTVTVTANDVSNPIMQG